jgi:hypothetical protein
VRGWAGRIARVPARVGPALTPASYLLLRSLGHTSTHAVRRRQPRSCLPCYNGTATLVHVPHPLSSAIQWTHYTTSRADGLRPAPRRALQATSSRRSPRSSSTSRTATTSSPCSCPTRLVATPRRSCAHRAPRSCLTQPAVNRVSQVDGSHASTGPALQQDPRGALLGKARAAALSGARLPGRRVVSQLLRSCFSAPQDKYGLTSHHHSCRRRFVNVSPTDSNIDETQNSLQYATRVRTIKVRSCTAVPVHVLALQAQCTAQVPYMHYALRV